jgi:hypothetical protein
MDKNKEADRELEEFIAENEVAVRFMNRGMADFVNGCLDIGIEPLYIYLTLSVTMDSLRDTFNPSPPALDMVERMTLAVRRKREQDMEASRTAMAGIGDFPDEAMAGMFNELMKNFKDFGG